MDIKQEVLKGFDCTGIPKDAETEGGTTGCEASNSKYLFDTNTASWIKVGNSTE